MRRSGAANTEADRLGLVQHSMEVARKPVQSTARDPRPGSLGIRSDCPGRRTVAPPGLGPYSARLGAIPRPPCGADVYCTSLPTVSPDTVVIPANGGVSGYGGGASDEAFELLGFAACRGIIHIGDKRHRNQEPFPARETSCRPVLPPACSWRAPLSTIEHLEGRHALWSENDGRASTFAKDVQRLLPRRSGSAGSLGELTPASSAGHDGALPFDPERNEPLFHVGDLVTRGPHASSRGTNTAWSPASRRAGRVRR